MKVVIAIDSYKGSLTSQQAGEACREGVLRACPGARTAVFPVADGGEGTLEVFMGLGMTWREETVTGPLGEKISAGYCAGAGRAFVEMARCAGLPLVPPDKRDPMNTTTRGVGELIIKAVEADAREIYLGIGGSATSDCGLGMLCALGFDFYDADGEKCGDKGGDLARVRRIDRSGADARLRECRFIVACDVTNPLYGENGAAHVYGPQKGASPETVEKLDEAARRFAALCPGDNALLPGAGAAGGLGFALREFLGAQLVPGIEFVLSALNIEREISDADLVFTGEGRLDRQSVMGKVPSGVAALAKKYGVPVAALSGCLGDGAEDCLSAGIDAYFPILSAPCTMEQAMDADAARENLSRTAQQAVRLFSAGRRHFGG